MSSSKARWKLGLLGVFLGVILRGARMPLSDTKIRSLKPKKKPYKVSDQGGLYISVQPHGSKLWRLKYRVNGREKSMSYGPYPLISLKEAREKRDRDKKILLEGQDPSVRKQMQKRAAVLNDDDTFASFTTELLEKNRREGKAVQTLKKKRWLIDQANAVLGLSDVSTLAADGSSKSVMSRAASLRSAPVSVSRRRRRSSGIVAGSGLASNRCS